MKTNLLPALVASLAALLPVSAQEPAPKGAPPAEAKPADKNIKDWGSPIDPEGDCKFKVEAGKLTITVPGEGKPHDLSPELASSTAPRVLQPLKGDFAIQVKVEGEFDPGDKSTQEGRTGYTGAGLAVFADEKNFVRIERATLHGQGGEPHAYTNFEIRVNGELEKIGTTADFATDGTKPMWLRLERKGDLLLGGMSQDGKNWTWGEPKELRAAAWQKPGVAGGIAAISTSEKSFAPIYSELTVGKSGELEAEKSEGK